MESLTVITLLRSDISTNLVDVRKAETQRASVVFQDKQGERARVKLSQHNKNKNKAHFCGKLGKLELEDC